MPTTIDWPIALRPATVAWGLHVPQRMGRSTFDGSVQAQTIGPPRWEFTITTGVIRPDEVPAWEAFTDQLDGAVNRVRAWDWRREEPLGPATGTPTVRVAATGGSALFTEGWTPGVAGILLAGSYFGVGVNGELKRLAATVASDGSGRATLTFRPPLRGTAAVGTPLVLAKPTALFVMTSGKPDFTQEGARTRGATLSFQEVPA